MKKLVLATAILLSAGLLSAGCSQSGEDGEAASPAATKEGAAATGESASAQARAIKPGTSILEPASATIGDRIAGEVVAVEGKAQSNFYRFANPLELRDRAVLRLENKSTTLKPQVKVYDSNRSEMFNLYDYTSSANLEREFTIEPGQDIYVEVGAVGNSEGKYELSITPLKAHDEYEPNDDQLSAAAFRFGDTIEANILDRNDPDWYQVTPPMVDKITISLENLSTTLKPFVTVYSSRKSQLVERYDTTAGAGLDFSVEVEPGEDFYVRVQPGFSSAGQYRLSVRPAMSASQIAEKIKQDGSVALYGIYFDSGKIFIKPESKSTLEKIAQLLRSDPGLRLEVAGHTDDVGSEEDNLKLSQGRAQSVVDALVGQYGIDPKRLVAKGYGESKPVAPNDTVANRARNRRVELKKI